jgi:hypothetical protein
MEVIPLRAKKLPNIQPGHPWARLEMTLNLNKDSEELGEWAKNHKDTEL